MLRVPSSRVIGLFEEQYSNSPASLGEAGF